MPDVRAGRWILVVIGLSSAACGGHRFVMPTGSGQPAPHAPDALAEATRACRAARTYSAALHVSGHVGAQRLPALLIFTGATADGGIYFDAKYHGEPIFTLGGTAERVTLVMHRDNTTLSAPADRVIEALVGVKLTPARWLALLTGCVTTSAGQTLSRAARFGTSIDAVLPDAEVLIEPRGVGWRIAGGVFDGLSVRYSPDAGAWPSSFTIATGAGVAPDVSLDVAASDPRVDDPQLATSGFAVPVPPGAATITLDQLRASGPLGKVS